MWMTATDCGYCTVHTAHTRRVQCEVDNECAIISIYERQISSSTRQRVSPPARPFQYISILKAAILMKLLSQGNRCQVHVISKSRIAANNCCVCTAAVAAVVNESAIASDTFLHVIHLWLLLLFIAGHYRFGLSFEWLIRWQSHR